MEISVVFNQMCLIYIYIYIYIFVWRWYSQYSDNHQAPMTSSLRSLNLYKHTHMLYTNNTCTNICRNIVNNNDELQWTNEHTIKINIYLSLYSRKGWCWLCVRGELETGTDCYILTPSSSDHNSTSFAFWLGCSTVGHRGPKALCLLLALNSASCPQLIPTATRIGTDPSRLWHLVI